MQLEERLFNIQDTFITRRELFKKEKEKQRVVFAYCFLSFR